jgi:PAS domain S-box-containing protein
VIAVTVSQIIASRRGLMEWIATHNELSLDLIATASFDGYFQQVNPAFTTILGFTAEEMCSRPLLEFVHPDDRDPTLAAIAEQAEQDGPFFSSRIAT